MHLAAEQSPFSVTIEKIIPGGLGLGRRDDGLVVMAAYTLPGEEVLVRPMQRKKNYLLAEVTDILKVSPDRTTPFCSHFGTCGGCDFQHINYEAQLRIKKELLLENMVQNGILSGTAAMSVIREPLPSPSRQGYRQRIRLQAVDGMTGFFKPSSHSIDPLASCPLAVATVNKTAEKFSFAATAGRLLGNVTNIEFLDNPDSTRVGCIVHMERKPRPAWLKQIKHIIDGIDEIEFTIFMVEGHGAVDISGRRCDSLPRLTFTLADHIARTPLQLGWEAGGFCQVNLEQNNNLIQAVLEYAASSSGKRILDLYCGMGNLTLPLARQCASIVGIEGQGSAIRSAIKNMETNTIDNCTFIKAAVPDGVKKLAGQGEHFDTIVLDPPRQGASDIIPLLPQLGATRIIYVSCDPATLGRDLAQLKAGGYHVTSILPVDMFPQNHHLETVVLLKWRSIPPKPDID